MVNSSDPKALQEKLQEVLSDEAFAKELLQMEKPEDVQVALEKKDIDLSLDEISQIGEYMNKVQNGEISQEQVQSMVDGELSEDELEEVAGGFIISLIVSLAIGGAIGAAGITILGISQGW